MDRPIGDSRVRDIYNYMKAQGYTAIRTKYRRGSTVNWARCEIGELKDHSRIVLQTGINNILSTKQSNSNIVHQFRKLVRENRNKEVVITSILPASSRKGDIPSRIFEINNELKKLAFQENIAYIDLTDLFMAGNELDYGLYKKEGRYIHLNDKGNEKFIRTIDEALRRKGDSFLKLTQVFWRTGPIRSSR